MTEQDYIVELELEIDNIWFIKLTYLPENIDKKEKKTLGYSKIMEFKKLIDNLTIKDYLSDKLKDLQVSNYKELINANSFEKLYLLKMRDCYKAEKLTLLIKIKNKINGEFKFSVYIKEKHSHESINDIKYYIENQIFNKIF